MRVFIRNCATIRVDVIDDQAIALLEDSVYELKAGVCMFAVCHVSR